MLTFFGHYVKLWKELSFMLTLILNLFIFFSYSTKYGDRMQDVHLFQMESYSTDVNFNIFFILCFYLKINKKFIILKKEN